MVVSLLMALPHLCRKPVSLSQSVGQSAAPTFELRLVLAASSPIGWIIGMCTRGRETKSCGEML